MQIDFRKLYTAPLESGQPDRGLGYFEHGTGKLKYYTDYESEWFFESRTGRPAFRVADGHVYV